MKNFKLLIFAFLFLLGGNISAQVNGINYQLKYDTVNCQYDALLIINSGSATEISERVQFNAQYSVVVPTGTTVTVTESYMPLIGNDAYTGTVPLDWDLTSTVINPASLPGFDFHAMVPNIDVTSHYNNVSAGDTIKLFSLSTSPIVNCGDDIRMYANGSDPTSSDDGMNSSDFSNGFTMGSPNQLYEGNSTELHPPKPFIASLTNACGDGLEIDLTATTSVCQGPLTYEWSGPDGYSSTDEDVNIQPATPAKNGWYVVTITDNFGCTTIDSIDATSKPSAGPDTLMCAGESLILSGSSPTTGTWAHADYNTFQGFVTLSPLLVDKFN